MLARRTVLAAALGLAVAGGGFYAWRDALFAQLAAGTRWVLVACGFETPDGATSAGAQRLRAVFYAVRMFEDVPPARLSADDAWAEAHFPGMGFGLVRTLDRTPVRVVLGGWRYVVPCAFFADARDCRRAGQTVARLRVAVPGVTAMTRDDVRAFLAVADPGIAHLTITGAADARAPWALPPPSARRPAAAADVPADFDVYAWPDGARVLLVSRAEPDARLLCTTLRAARARGIAARCTDRFDHGDAVRVELRYDRAHLARWAELRAAVRQRLDAFRGGAPPPDRT